MRAIFFLLCMCVAVHHISCSSLKRKLSSRKQGFLTEIQEKNSKRGGFYNGCPEDNDFWTQGQISSPFWPQNYHNNESCYYYINAEQGAVVKIVFTHFDLELCCDYITIYDGAASGKSRVIAQLGGQGGATQPQSAYYSTTNQMLVTFMSNPTVTKSGFQFTYSSVTTARPCNRDISISINGMDSVGSQSNFVQQLRFLAQNLVASWDVGLDRVRVGMNLITDDDYAVVWKYNDFKTTDQVQFAILGMTDDVPNVLANNNSDFASMFNYAEGDSGPFDSKSGGRDGIQNVAIVFVAQMPCDDQDWYESVYYAHLIKNRFDGILITVAMGANLNMTYIGQLSSGRGYYFGADYDHLYTLTSAINSAICQLPGLP